MKRGQMLSNAIVIATNAHAGQFDRGGKTLASMGKVKGRIIEALTVMEKKDD